MQDTDFASNNFFSDEVNVNLNVFCPLVLNWIHRKVYCTNGITMHNGGLWDRGSMQLTKEISKPTRPTTTFATPQYSASALDLETIGWLMEDQEIKLLLRKTQQAPVALIPCLTDIFP